MKHHLIALLTGFILVTALGSSALAQTPDGVTPANEGVCDPLRDDGITKGLYGLCVAFCEAQDHASLVGPITEDEYESLAQAKPAGKILANYNKKKQESDPAMPCIKVEEPCPCWSTEELASVDGIMFDGSMADSVTCDITTDGDPDLYEIITATEFFDIPGSGLRYSQARTWEDNRNGDFAFCEWANFQNNADNDFIFRRFFRQNGEITPEQLESCQSALRSHLETISSSCTTGSQVP